MGKAWIAVAGVAAVLGLLVVLQWVNRWRISRIKAARWR